MRGPCDPAIRRPAAERTVWYTTFVHPFPAALAQGDPGAAIAQLSDDVVFRSPIVFSQYTGKDAVRPLITAVVNVFEDFRYIHELAGPDGPDHAFVFQARVKDRAIEGCDFIRLGADGLIDELVVMVRPLSGAIALAEAMREELG